MSADEISLQAAQEKDAWVFKAKPQSISLSDFLDTTIIIRLIRHDEQAEFKRGVKT